MPQVSNSQVSNGQPHTAQSNPRSRRSDFGIAAIRTSGGEIWRRHNILTVVSMAMTTMPRLQVTFYRHRTRPGVIGVSPVSSNLVFPEPDDWELERQDVINTDLVVPGSEIASWLEAFRPLAIVCWSQAVRRVRRATMSPAPRRQDGSADTIARPPSISGLIGVSSRRPFGLHQPLVCAAANLNLD
jgi:hypothetical protein